MTRLIRTLTAVLGILIAFGGGTFALVQATGGAGRSHATVAGNSANQTNSAPSKPDTSNGGPLSSVGTGARSPGAKAIARGDQPTTTLFPALAALTSALDTALAGSNSCLSVQDSRGRVLYQHQPSIALIPASTQKLLVAAAALTVLGSDFRFTTQVVAPAAPVKGKVAALWLVGSGDPMLATPEFIAAGNGRARVANYPWTPIDLLAHSLVAAGVNVVSGGVRGDDSFEDRLRFLPVWPPIYQQQNQVGLLSALSVNEGIQFTPPKPILAQDPPANAAGELARLLQGRHVAVGTAPDQAAPAGTVVLASVSSPPLTQLIEAMLRASDNWIAELLVRAIDKASGGAGTTAGGTAIVMRDAAVAGIPMSGVQMDDGSGLARTDRATCPELLAALNLASQPAYAPIATGLAVAAQTGTLATRYRGTPLAGILRAKTGSLDNAGGMVGVVTAPAITHFAFLDNDVQSETALYIREDAVVAALAAYSGGG